MNSSVSSWRRFLVPAAALAFALSACADSVEADVGADGSVELLTHDSGGSGSEALGSFTLQFDSELNCLYHNEADNNEEPGTGGRVVVVWPEGYSALVDGDEVNVRDEAGVVVARTNATFQIAGGSGPADGHCDSIGAWWANGGPIE